MSVIVKGMEMPKACCFCEFSEGKNYWCRAAKRDWGADPYNSVADFCPLVELPPHGRLIDADALSGECVPEPTFIAETLFRKLNNAPTIIEAEDGT